VDQDAMRGSSSSSRRFEGINQ